MTDELSTSRLTERYVRRMADEGRSVEDIDYDVAHARLRAVREGLGLGAAETGEAVGLTRQYLTALELSRTPPAWGHIVRLAAYYGTTVDFLLGASWAKNPERGAGTAMSEEALRAARSIDAIPDVKERRIFLRMIELQREVLEELQGVRERDQEEAASSTSDSSSDS